MVVLSWGGSRGHELIQMPLKLRGGSCGSGVQPPPPPQWCSVDSNLHRHVAPAPPGPLCSKGVRCAQSQPFYSVPCPCDLVLMGEEQEDKGVQEKGMMELDEEAHALQPQGC